MDTNCILRANYVFTTSLCCKFDLRELTMKACNMEYNPRKFSAIIYKDKKFRTTILIFSTGYLVITGVKKPQVALQSVKNLVKLVKNIGYKPILQDLMVRNITASYTLPYQINLDKFCEKHKNVCSYEMELFSGCFYRSQLENKVVVILFKSGKVIITGAKKDDQIENVFYREVLGKIEECKL